MHPGQNVLIECVNFILDCLLNGTIKEISKTQCDYCCKRYLRVANLKKHMESQHRALNKKDDSEVNNEEEENTESVLKLTSISNVSNCEICVIVPNDENALKQHI